MPSVSEKQARFMAAAAHDPAFAKRVGIKRSVARDFNAADTGTSLLSKAMRNRPAKVKKAKGGKISLPELLRHWKLTSSYGWWLGDSPTPEQLQEHYDRTSNLFNRFSPDQQKDIFKRLQAGDAPEDIAKDYGVNTFRLDYYLNRLKGMQGKGFASGGPVRDPLSVGPTSPRGALGTLGATAKVGDLGGATRPRGGLSKRPSAARPRAGTALSGRPLPRPGRGSNALLATSAMPAFEASDRLERLRKGMKAPIKTQR